MPINANAIQLAGPVFPIETLTEQHGYVLIISASDRYWTPYAAHVGSRSSNGVIHDHARDAIHNHKCGDPVGWMALPFSKADVKTAIDAGVEIKRIQDAKNNPVFQPDEVSDLVTFIDETMKVYVRLNNARRTFSRLLSRIGTHEDSKWMPENAPDELVMARIFVSRWADGDKPEDELMNEFKDHYAQIKAEQRNDKVDQHTQSSAVRARAHQLSHSPSVR